MTAFLVMALWFTLAGVLAVLLQCLYVMVLGKPFDLLSPSTTSPVTPISRVTLSEARGAPLAPKSTVQPRASSSPAGARGDREDRSGT